MSRIRLPGRPRRTSRHRGRARAAILAGTLVLAVLAIAGIAAHPPAGGERARPAAAALPARTALTADTLPAAPAAPLPGTGSCGLLDASCYVSSAITSWFAGLVSSAAGPLLALIGRSALSTPQPGAVPAVRTLWTAGLGIADACYALLVLAGAIIVMSHQTLQTSYAAKEIAPRVVVGFLAANLSMIGMTRAVSLANGLSAAFTAGGVNPRTAAATLITTLGNAAATHGIFLILLALAGVVLALMLAAVYVLRLMAVVLLAAAAPLCLALYALPQTAWAARWWCRALTAALAVQAIQALVLTAAVQVFLAPGWLPGDTGSALAQTLITVCLLWILVRIPSWVARPVLSPFGGSPLRRAARFAITTAVLSRLAPVLSGHQPAHRARGAARTGRSAPPGRGPGRTGKSGPAPASGGAPAAPGPRPPARPRHAAPPPLPGGGSGRPGRHEAPPPLPADHRPQRPAPPASRPPLPAVRPRHAAPPPLPAARPRHAPPPPLPAAAVPPAARPPRP